MGSVEDPNVMANLAVAEEGVIVFQTRSSRVLRLAGPCQLAGRP
jgi:hypothetical protein